MSTQQYEIAITATAEVRDAEGNLISAEPVESTVVVTEEQMHAMGLHHESEKP